MPMVKRTLINVVNHVPFCLVEFEVRFGICKKNKLDKVIEKNDKDTNGGTQVLRSTGSILCRLVLCLPQPFVTYLTLRT